MTTEPELDPYTRKEASKAAALIWLAASAVAGLGTWVAYDAIPGVNWVLWTSMAVLGLALLLARRGHPLPALPATTGAIAVVIAGGAAISADDFMHVLIVLSVALFLALTMLLASDPRIGQISTVFVITAPFVAAARTVFESITRAAEGSLMVRSHRARSTLRGVVITVPVVLVFALLLAGADPVFATWRDAVGRILESWAFLPRTVFFLVLLAVVLGAYGNVVRRRESTMPADVPGPRLEGDSHARWLGATERLILLGSVAALFWVFLAVQLSYLFGNLPETPGSGMTFAEHARRGFAELTVVATCTVLLVVVSERYGQAVRREGLITTITMSVIAAVFLLLASAFHRVSLYEAAYGFTTARLHAQVFMVVVAITLFALAVEVWQGIDASRLFRRAGLAALLALIVLVYWNHEAWIARANINRFAATGKLDTVYLTRGLSPNAVPVIVELLPSLPEPARAQLQAAVSLRYTGRVRLKQRRWYEWNLARARAVNALEQIGVSLEPVK